MSVLCPPKLNLTLAVGPPRPDGLHPIASLMLGLGPGFADLIEVERTDTKTSAFEIAFASDAPIRQNVDWPIASDLAYRAHALLEQDVGRALPVRCRVTKRIPAGAGLGGGSSDAAGMLVGLRHLFKLLITDDRLVELGSTLGSDVGFCVHAALGRRLAWVAGVGEKITPLPGDCTFHAVLLFCDSPCPTAAVYRRFDELNAQQYRGKLPEKPEQMTAPLHDIAAYNDLAIAAFDVCPPMRDVSEAARGLGLTAYVCGSGSTLFVPCSSEMQADARSQQCEEQGLIAVAVNTRN